MARTPSKMAVLDIQAELSTGERLKHPLCVKVEFGLDLPLHTPL